MSIREYVISQYPYLAKPANAKMLGIVINITEMAGPAEYRKPYQPKSRLQRYGQAKIENSVFAGSLKVANNLKEQ